MRLLCLLALLLPLLSSVGCTPHIGDKCTLSTDCSQQGTLLCDTSQPGGYCTSFDCTGDSCPQGASCIFFSASVPGCAYTDRNPSRVGRSFCMAQCDKLSDCRDDYICADPKGAPWNAFDLDDDQSKSVCIVAPDSTTEMPDANPYEDPDAAVCGVAGPMLPPIDAGVLILDDAGSFDAGTADAADAATD
jgi:hypothetical protein